MKKQMILLLLFLLLSLTAFCAHAEIMDCFPEEKAANSAYHLMVGMFGYTEAEAQALRYETSIEDGSIATHVSVYPPFPSDACFSLSYLGDGSLNDNITVPDWYTVPSHPTSSDDVILAARHLMTGLYGYTPKVAEQFQYQAVAHPDIHWIDVFVYPFPDMEECFSLGYNECGLLMSEVLPDILDFGAYASYVKEVGRPFMWFTHEERAVYSQVFIPKVEAAMRLNPFSFDVLAHYDYTRCVYGIPAQSDLPEETALEIARGVLIDSFGRSDEWVQNAGTESYFDISDPNQPLWKFFFTHWDGVEQRQYVVRLQAETGEVIKAFEYTSDCESYSKKYLAEHEPDILLHKAAKKAFDEQGLQKLPTVKKLQSEYAELLVQKKRNYTAYRQARDEMRELLKAKANVDRILGNENRTGNTEKEQAQH